MWQHLYLNESRVTEEERNGKGKVEGKGSEEGRQWREVVAIKEEAVKRDPYSSEQQTGHQSIK